MPQLNNDKILANLFLEVLVSVKLVAHKISDGYFVELLSGQLAELFSNFLECLKAPSKKTTEELSLKTDDLVQMLETLHHAGEISKLDFLQALKPTLSFKASVITFKDYLRQVDPLLKFKTETVDKFISVPKQAIPKVANLNPIKKDLLGIIKSKKEVLNLDLFALMPNLTKRSIKRHLSELIHGGYVSRKSFGKKVYYTTKDNHLIAN